MSQIIQIKTISQVHKFYGLKKPDHPLITVLSIDDVLLNADYGNYTYVFDLYHISYKSGEAGFMGYGRNTYDFQEGTMTFIKPNQSIKIKNKPRKSDGQGWTLIFHPDLIRKSNLGQTIDAFSFFSYSINEALHLSEKEQKTIRALVFKIKEEYSQNIDQHSQELMVTNLELLLKYCRRYYDRQFYTRTNLNKDIITKLEQLLKAYYNSEYPINLGIPTVKYCGVCLNMSPKYLSDLLKKETGRNAQDHIHHFLIEKAKTALLSSTIPISTIAYDLGFEYPQHFSNVFKKKTGISPRTYRQQN